MTAPVLPNTDVTVPGAVATAAVTNAVVANCVVLVAGAAVGAVGIPENAGDAVGAAPVICPTE